MKTLIPYVLNDIDALRPRVKNTHFKLWARITSFRHAVEANQLSTARMYSVLNKFTRAVETHTTTPRRSS